VQKTTAPTLLVAKAFGVGDACHGRRTVALVRGRKILEQCMLSSPESRKGSGDNFSASCFLEARNKTRQKRLGPRLCEVATASLPSERLGWLLRRRILLYRRLSRPRRILHRRILLLLRSRLVWLLHRSLYLIPGRM
jgi:hypothetical protein